jgi:hypothetical protein
VDDPPTKAPGNIARSCPQCGLGLGPTDRFCASCGLELRGDTEAISALISRMLPERIDAALKDRIREQKVVEVETAQLIAERAIKWLQVFGFLLGIPGLLLVAIFSFVGVKTWSDLKNVAEQTSELQKNLSEPRRQLAFTTQKIEQLQKNFETAEQSLLHVNQRQDVLQNQLNAIKGRLDFCPGGAASAEDKEKLQDVLSKFIIWLQTIGFHRLDQNVSICIYTKDSPIPIVKETLTTLGAPTSFYSGDTLYIDKAFSTDMSVPVHVYSHHALLNAVREDLTGIAEIERALADYLSASFLQSPVVGALGGRTLANTSVYSSSMDVQERGLVWGGALWTCREKAQKQMDELVLPAWEAAANSNNPGKELKLFSDKIKADPAPVGTCFSDEIKRRKLPH